MMIRIVSDELFESFPATHIRWKKNQWLKINRNSFFLWNTVHVTRDKTVDDDDDELMMNSFIVRLF